MKLPVGVEFVKKDTWEVDSKTGKSKRKSSITNNELFRKMLKECDGKFHFNYVLADSWYSSAENMICCKEELNNHFIMALKSNTGFAKSPTKTIKTHPRQSRTERS